VQVYINNGYILNKFGLLAEVESEPLADQEPSTDGERGLIALLMNDDAWHTILFVSSQITLYTLGIALTVTDRKNAFARQVSLAAIAVIWIVTLGLDAGTASIKPTKSHFYDVHMAGAAFHLVFAFAVTVSPTRLHSCGAQTHLSLSCWSKSTRTTTTSLRALGTTPRCQTGPRAFTDA
jgi:hypothetical protein